MSNILSWILIYCSKFSIPYSLECPLLQKINSAYNSESGGSWTAYIAFHIPFQFSIGPDFTPDFDVQKYGHVSLSIFGIVSRQYEKLLLIQKNSKGSVLNGQ